MEIDRQIALTYRMECVSLLAATAAMELAIYTFIHQGVLYGLINIALVVFLLPLIVGQQEIRAKLRRIQRRHG